MLSNRLSKVGSSKTAEARSEASRLQEQGISVINLTAGELAVHPPEEIKKAAIESILKNTNRYTDTIGIESLRGLIAEKSSERIGVPFTKNEVAITSGAKQGLFNMAFALFNPGDKVVIPIPCWGTFVAQLQMLDIQPCLLDTSSHSYQIDCEKLKQCIDSKTKGIILNTPNNPTGIVYSKKTLESIAEIVEKFNLWLIFDECYHQIVYPQSLHTHILMLNPDLKDKVITIDSFSKSHAITGWRIGYVLARKEIISGIKAFQSHSTSNPNVIAQHAALHAYDSPFQEFSSRINQQIYKNFCLAKEILDSIPYISYVEPQGAFYIFVNLAWYLENNSSSITTIEELCHFLLLESHVAVVGGAAFYAPSYIRISISNSEKEVKEGLFRLKKGLAMLSSAKLVHI